jgi:hypothetical protein
MITITNTITINIAIAIANISISPTPDAHGYATIGRKQAAYSTSKSQLEICSPQVQIVDLSCRIYCYNCQLHDHEAS